MKSLSTTYSSPTPFSITRHRQGTQGNPLDDAAFGEDFTLSDAELKQMAASLEHPDPTDILEVKGPPPTQKNESNPILGMLLGASIGVVAVLGFNRLLKYMKTKNIKNLEGQYKASAAERVEPQMPSAEAHPKPASQPLKPSVSLANISSNEKARSQVSQFQKTGILEYDTPLEPGFHYRQPGTKRTVVYHPEDSWLRRFLGTTASMLMEKGKDQHYAKMVELQTVVDKLKQIPHVNSTLNEVQVSLGQCLEQKQFSDMDKALLFKLLAHKVDVPLRVVNGTRTVQGTEQPHLWLEFKQATPSSPASRSLEKTYILDVITLNPVKGLPLQKH
jgi:hypothetical protein